MTTLTQLNNSIQKAIFTINIERIIIDDHFDI